MVSQADNAKGKNASPKKGGRGKGDTRRVAGAMLAAITRGKTMDEARDRLSDLPDSERNLADAMVQMALRHYGEINALTAKHLKRALPLRPHIAHGLLCIGVAQLVYMNVPAHAAIHETVAATGRREQPFRGLINAVLRQIERDIQADGLPKPAPRENLPEWMQARFEAAYGGAALDAMVTQHTRTPPLDLGFKSREKASAFVAAHEGAEPLNDTHVRLNRSGDVRALDGFKEGDWFVQDVAAGYPARLLEAELAAISTPETPASVLDLCAAPGGKTLQLAAAGYAVTALDISANRLARVKENLKRTKLKANLVKADALNWQSPKQFDAVLLDAPCSASGTMRRHPDLVLNRHEGYIAKLAAFQQQLLARATDWVKPGGFLCYAVCSLDPEEGEAQAQAFLETHADFRVVTPQNLPAHLTHDQAFRSTPADHPLAQARYLGDMEKGGMDGFFAQIFQKIGA